ncbi:MAG: hypothetical protein K9W43_14325 [Candidatus Thorarchaeota archaeon]|nr:hypothetical protein [Candidatus Thorarchaeota archaeon]
MTIQILPVMLIEIPSESNRPLSPRFAEDLLNGNIGTNIKQRIIELVSASLRSSLENVDAAWTQAFETFKILRLVFDSVQEKRIQLLLEQKYGPALSANFGLAINTLIAFLQLVESKMTDSILTDNKIDTDLIAQVIENPILSTYSKNSEMQFPSELAITTESPALKLIRSVLFACNVASFSTLVLLAVSLANAELEIDHSRITQIEQLLRDWTLDILIQVDESLHTELDVRGPLDISVPFHAEDGELAEMDL